jgi:hypothetical protein
LLRSRYLPCRARSGKRPERSCIRFNLAVTDFGYTAEDSELDILAIADEREERG